MIVRMYKWAGTPGRLRGPREPVQAACRIGATGVTVVRVAGRPGIGSSLCERTSVKCRGKARALTQKWMNLERSCSVGEKFPFQSHMERKLGTPGVCKTLALTKGPVLPRASGWLALHTLAARHRTLES